MNGLPRWIATAMVGLVVGGACAGGGQDLPAPRFDVAITRNFTFSPAQLEVPVGATVVWTNQDSTTHTVTAGMPGSPSGRFSLTVEAGKIAGQTFAQAGTFEYFCSIHQTMRGTITVK